MKKATTGDLELGNLFFGNSRGEYAVEPREEYQEIFCKFLEDNGFDSYGAYAGADSSYENDTFVIRTYYWGDDEEQGRLPNFIYKPTGLEIKWYKYPLRDAYSNQDVGVEEFKEIMDKCARYIN